ncbi:hypothetical protein Zmor_015637 [Zophobas morio]|uniref:NADP-dependent oxidoreductase domain-containing protein n=1 Tax=Zophobas morio TaxID=2755281 RepID=A0AA38IH17_9CUCU|nr:hypothetical protein Zmor_015637 [Zophobas morio]
MCALPETYVPGFHDKNEVQKMKYIKFGDTDMNISQLSLGTAGFCYFFGGYDLEKCKATVHEAVKRGINFIDTAPFYGHGVSEEVLGKCLEGIPRKAYYLATKVGRYEKDPKFMFDYSGKKTRESIEVSLKRLGVDYVDLLQVHSLEHANPDVVLNETLPVLEELRKQGKTRYVGVTSYPVSLLQDYLKKSTVKIDSVLSFTRLSLLNQTLREYIPFFQSKNVAIINAAPHCVGMLSSSGPPEWQRASQDIKDLCAEAREYCKKNDVEIGRLALYYALAQEGPHTILVGMNNTDILNINMDVMYNGLTDKEKKVYEHVKNNIMTKLSKTDWE